MTTSVRPRENGCWVVVKHEDLVSELKGSVISIESFAVHVSAASVWCPYIVQWSDRDLVKKRYVLQKEEGQCCEDKPTGVHGFADSNVNKRHWDRSTDIAPMLCHNIWEFALSDIQGAYMKLMGDIAEKGSLSNCCPPGTLKIFYADNAKKVGGIPCYLPSLSDDEGKDTLSLFLEKMSSLSQICEMYEKYSEPLIKSLLRYGVEIEVDDEFPIFNDSYIFPLDALRKVLLFFQELEQNNFIYPIHENRPVDPIQFKVFVPKSDTPITITADVEVLVGMTDGSGCCIACEEEIVEEGLDVKRQDSMNPRDVTEDEIKEVEAMLQQPCHPKIMALTEKLDFHSSRYCLIKNFLASGGIESVKHKSCICLNEQ